MRIREIKQGAELRKEAAALISSLREASGWTDYRTNERIQELLDEVTNAFKAATVTRRPAP